MTAIALPLLILPKMPIDKKEKGTVNDRQVAMLAAAMSFSGVTLSDDEGVVDQASRDAIVMETADRFLDWILGEGEEPDDEPEPDPGLYLADEDYEEFDVSALRGAIHYRLLDRGEEEIPHVENRSRDDLIFWLRNDDVENPR